MTPPTPAIGLHRGVSEAAYRSWDAINQSRIKGAPTALHLRHQLTAPPEEPTDAMILGTLIDAALLEPARFHELVAVGPDGATRATKAWKDWAATQPANKILLKPAEAEEAEATLNGMAAALREHPAASALLDAAGDSQVSMLWRDEESGLLCKGRIDRLPTDHQVVIDLKTCRSASPWAFAKAVVDYGYDVQAAMYLDGYAACTGDNSRQFVWVCVENTAPYAVAVYSAEDFIEAGRRLYRRALSQIVHGRKTGQWPGFPEGVERLECPLWHMERAGVEEVVAE